MIDEEEERIEVVVPDDQLSLAIGRRGQNVRLASQLTGSAIDILTEADASEKRQREFVERSEMFQNELDVDETLAQLLVAEGFGSLEEVAYVQLDEIASIEGFDEDLATELQSRAQEALERREEAAREERRGLGVSDELAEMPLSHRADAGDARQGGHQDARRSRRSRHRRAGRRRSAPSRAASARRPNRPEDKGGILAEYGLSEEQGNEIIMAARAHWFEDEEPNGGGRGCGNLPMRR